MIQSRITDYFSKEWVYESPKQKITRIIKELNDGLYKEASIRIESSEYNDNPYKDSIEDSDVILLCKALKKNPQVKNVVFYLQNVGDKSLINLSKINTLDSVSISCGDFGIIGAEYLAKAPLKYLYLEGGNIFHYKDGDRRDYNEIKPFIQALIENKTIKELDLSNSFIYDELVIKLIENTKTIKSFYLDRKGFNKELFKDLHIKQQEMHIYTDEEIVLLGDEMQDNNT